MITEQTYRNLFLGITLFLLPSFIQAQNFFKLIQPDFETTRRAKESLSKVDHYQVDISAISRALNQSNTIEIQIPIGKLQKTILLEKTNILSPDYQLHTGSGKSMNTASKYAFYHGSVKDKVGSKVSMIFYDNTFSISIFDKDGNFEINSVNSDIYAGYYNHDRKEILDLDWDCQIIEDTQAQDKEETPGSRSSMTPECVTVFLEIDNNMYVKKGSSIPNTEAWAMTLFSQVAILYMEHNVPINISGIQVWDTLDPYISATTTSAALSLFRSAVHNNPNFNGRLAHLLSGRGLGGGIAYLNTLCSSFNNVAVSANLSSNNVPYPTYSWNVMVVAHEMGHNMGSNHTHACVWNGNNTAIDGCGPIQGGCPDPVNPPDSIGGTIMSYCHQTSAGINFNNGFGPQPGALIESRYLNATCTTGTNCSYVPPFNDVCLRSKELPILNYCINGYFENYATTASNNGGNMSCGDSGVENDIWFQFEYLDLDTIHLIFEATDIISDLVVEIYAGDCNNLSSIACGFTVNGDPINFMLTDTNLVNETLYIRVVEKESDEEGEFSICIYSNELPCQELVDTLLNIYETLDGDNWTNNSGWNAGFAEGACDYCNWYGVKCDYLGRIFEIDLSNNNLSGPFPQDVVHLEDLSVLKLNNNLLTDTIPNFWDSLDLLFLLDLRFNGLSGSIPKSFTTMTKINSIHLDNNVLENEIPSGLGFNSSLYTFTASNNLLEGCFSAGVVNFCYKDSINLNNNPDLPYAGDVTLLCEEGWGADSDLDGFCNEIEDCDDNDADINPDATEVLCDAKDNNCDGVIDEGSDFGPNIWIGPDTLGVFDDTLNWSLGHIPTICENIEIGLAGETIELILLGNTSGGGQGGGIEGSGPLKIRDLIIGTNTTLRLPQGSSMSNLGNGVIVNNGTLIIAGYANIGDQINTTNTAFLNNGTLTILETGGLSIFEIGDFGLHNTSTGVVNMDGFSYIESFNSEVAKSALINEGTFNLIGSLYIYGDYIDQDLKIASNSIFEVKAGATLTFY